jgi:methylmalonyl-CoA decarboxylase
MFATADPVAAERALATGLLNHLVQPANLETFTLDMARRIAANAPLTVSSAKQHLRAFASALPITAALAQVLAESRAKALTSADYAEGLEAFGAKRKPQFTGR